MNKKQIMLVMSCCLVTFFLQAAELPPLARINEKNASEQQELPMIQKDEAITLKQLVALPTGQLRG